MWRPIRKLLLFTAIVALLDLPFRWAMERLPAREYDDRLGRVLDGRIDQDILVFGSSRAARDVVPQRIAELTGRTAYGLGYPGASIEFQEFVLRQVLRSPHPPRTVLLVVDDPSELITTPKVDFRLDRAYPLAGYPVVNDEICRRTGKSLVLTRLMAAYRIKESLHHLWDPPRPEELDTIYADGSMTTLLHAPSLDTTVFRDTPRHYSAKRTSADLRAAFERFVQACADHGVQLVIVYPPDLRAMNTAFADHLDALAGGRALSYRFDTSKAIYRDKRYYYDYAHLDREGARIFSEDLAAFLREHAPR